MGTMKIGELGERSAIDRIWNIIGKSENYDDCVYIDQGGHYELITTDFIGEGTHFLSNWDARKVGKFFASVNLSDIAAMGGIPQIFMASMFFPKNLEVEFLDNFILGMMDILKEFNVDYRGGDLKESKIIGFTGIAIGHVEKDRIMRRDTIKKDDAVYVTGELGKQAAGYFLWKNGVGEGINYLLDIHPKINEGREISKFAEACMDLSDGLASAVKFMRNDFYGLKIDFDSLPIHKLAYEVSEDYKIPLELLATRFGGEYELVYTSPKKVVGKEIGIVDKKENAGIWRGERKIEGDGYAHFSKILDKT